jgi:tetratricopeptide (TPR) repeat protein
LVHRSVDSTSIRLNLEIATIYLYNQNDSGLIYSQNTLDLAQKQDDYIEVFNHVKGLAFEVTQLGSISLNRACYEQLESFSKTIKNDSLLAISLYGIASSEFSEGNNNKSLATIEKVISLLKDANLSPLQVIIIDNFRGRLYNALQQYEKLIILYIKALKSAEKHQLLDQQVLCLGGLSRIHLEQDNFDDAINFSLQALDITIAIKLLYTMVFTFE